MIQFCLDWLHLTMPFNADKPLQMWMYPISGQPKAQHTSARYGYAYGMANSVNAKVMVNPDKPDMGIHVSYSASTLRAYLERGIESMTILRWHLGQGGKCSRIDLALDVFDSCLSIVALYEDLVQGRALTRVLNYTLLKAQGDGTTLYVGSRSSEAMLRIYDKAKEQGVLDNWKRIELECKGDKANYVANTLAELPDEEIVKQAKRFIVGIVTFPNSCWSKMLRTEGTKIGVANKKQTDTAQWLLNVAAPSLGKYVGRTQDEHFLRQFLRQVRVNRYGVQSED